MELGLKGKNIIITGGGSNIGRAIVHAFAAEGSKIIIAELAPEQGEKVAHEHTNFINSIRLSPDNSKFMTVSRPL